ncbi:MAG: alanine--tRNA ligase [Anaerolineae bacterium]
MITSADVRKKFLDYFARHDHAIVKSSALVPGNDPTLLFANAGMVQFKEVFLGIETRPYKRATTSQKCMRVSGKHNDLDAVGPSPRHHTFFEMLGNFSFGDYFKREAIGYAWEFLTQELGLDPARLYPTVYLDDDDAFNLWQEVSGLPAERITRLGKKDNFWAMGDTGPCGPSSEIIWDRGPEACTCGRPDCNLAHECDRWLELWNLVFMQFEAREDLSMVPLPNPSIDTGLGLERITSVLQGASNNYDTDLFLPIIRRTQELLGVDDAARLANPVPYRVIADHSRAVTFLIADGVLPGNEGRSYVLRMILRRAARFGKLLGFDRPFLAETAQAVIDTMGSHYAELVERQDFIRAAITQEEERFLSTLSTGLSRLDVLAARLKEQGSRVVPGEEAFRLYDTYGFPLELTRDAALELGLTVDEQGFRTAMAAQRERARSAQRFAVGAEADFYRKLDLPPTEFLGYDACVAEAHVIALVREGQRVERVKSGDEVEVVLSATPFYGESGGQVGDTGALRGPEGRIQVENSVRPTPDTIVHHGRVLEGSVTAGDLVEARVDEERRLDIARNHTATHLLHRALRMVLGEHAAQAGSLVAPERLRFDFAHLSPLSRDDLRRVSAIVNEQVRANVAVTTRVSSFDDAVRSGAVALFGEKYGEVVRAVSVEGYTIELCGGTHLHATGQVGFFVIVSEASIGSGLRRIEALTGRGAEAYVQQRLDALGAIAESLSARPGEELERIEALQGQLREQRHAIQDLQRQLTAGGIESLLHAAVDIDGVRVLVARVDVPGVDAMRELSDRLRDKLGSSVVALGAVFEERPVLVVSVTQDLMDKGLHAGKLAGAAAKHMGGGGGGRPNMAQAGGKDVAKLGEALEAVPGLVKQALT